MNETCVVVMAQVVVLSEGNQVYMGRPDKAVEWFSLKLGYSYQPVRDGAVSDWLMDLVSVGFQKPPSYAARYAHLCCNCQVVLPSVYSKSRFAQQTQCDM